MSKEIVMTHQGLLALEQELEELKTVKRKEVAEKIKIARSFGDLSENSEYDEAKNEQGFIESRIIQLEKMLQNVKILDEEDVATDMVSIGAQVKVKDAKGQSATYDIVGSTEADPVLGKISDESPVGSALIGRKVGEKVQILLPNGNTLMLEITNIGKQNLKSKAN